MGINILAIMDPKECVDELAALHEAYRIATNVNAKFGCREDTNETALFDWCDEYTGDDTDSILELSEAVQVFSQPDAEPWYVIDADEAVHYCSKQAYFTPLVEDWKKVLKDAEAQGFTHCVFLKARL